MGNSGKLALASGQREAGRGGMAFTPACVHLDLWDWGNAEGIER